MDLKVFVCGFALLNVLNFSNSANILMVSSMPFRSHNIWNEALCLALVKRGHNVTMLAHDQVAKNVANFTLVKLEEHYSSAFDFDRFAELSAIATIRSMYDYSHAVCAEDVRSSGFARLLRYPPDFRFALILWDAHLGQCMYPLMDRYGAHVPVVATSPFGLQHVIARAFGTAIPFYPFYTASTTYDRMTYAQRLSHHWHVNFMAWYYRLRYLPAQRRVAREAFDRADVPPLETYERRFQLLLTNTDPLMDYAMPLAPNVVPVAGIHITAARPLPDDVRRLLDAESSRGAVYFALGSTVEPSALAKFDRILRAIARLPYRVLWKIDAEGLTPGSLPANVVAREWFPQNDVLAHKNVKMFISHGGALSTQEAVYHGVPLLVVPLFLDQLSNAMRLTDRKVAVAVPYANLTADNLYEGAMEVLTNPIYVENARKLSSMFGDRLNTPLERAVHWAEYALKHKDLGHLNVFDRDMYAYETIHLDLLLIVTGFVATIVAIAIYLWIACSKGPKRLNDKMKKS